MIKKNKKASEIIAIIMLIVIVVLILILFVADNDRKEIEPSSVDCISDDTNYESEKMIIQKHNKDSIESENIIKSESVEENVQSQPESKPIKEKIIHEEKKQKSVSSNQNSIYVAYYGNIPLTQNDMNMMCTIVSSEAGYCDDMAQKAIAHTILNRFNDSRFPNTMYEITTQENQYTAIHSYFDGQYREGLYPGSELWNHSMQLCYEALNEWDFTGGAFAYYNPQMIGYNAWFESLQFTYQNQYARFFTF